MAELTANTHHTDFIRNKIDKDIEENKHPEGLVFRFPPEPNGFLHIGHAKAICVNFGLANHYKGKCHLRFDDTNPANEEEKYALSIKEDVNWLGGDWSDHLYHASDYFEELYERACQLIKQGDAYIDSLSAQEMREYRGTLTEPGKNSPHRERSVEESLDLFARMRQGEFDEGTHCLRAKIDMASGNVNMRDPVMYRILKSHHQRTGDQWLIYPMYDFAHSLSDAIEGITHSLCTLEFQDHRPLYDWFIERCNMSSKPQQIEFSRLNINYLITSKRKLKQLIEEGHVQSWNDPRMPTLSGLRRRGYTKESIQQFCAQVGVSKQNSVIDLSVLEDCARTHLNQVSVRRNVVLDPVLLTIRNYPEDKVEHLTVSNHPQNPDFGTREVPLTRQVYIDRNDFQFDPPKKFFRLAPDREVRLLNAYAVRCVDVITDDAGKVIELIGEYDPDTLGGKKPADGRKIKGVVHWVSAKSAVDATVRVYDRLFNIPNPGQCDALEEALNPNSLVVHNAKCEPMVQNDSVGTPIQFNRVGYYVLDSEDHMQGEKIVFNQVVPLRSAWEKVV